MKRLCVIAALLATAVLSLPAQVRDRDFGRADWCEDGRDSSGPRRSASFCEIRQATVSQQRNVDVDSGANGGIAVRGWDSADVHVRARVSADAPTEAEARTLVSQVTLTTTGGRIRVEGPETRRDASWSASFEVLAPRNSALTLNARNGGLNIANFSGSVNMQTVNGGVAVSDVSGDIRGRTQNGGLNVELSGPTWDGRGLDLETTNGGVSLNLPADYSAELETGTVNGGMRIDFPVTVQGRLGQQIKTRLGSGGPTIRALTTNGGVNVRRR